HRAAIAVEGVLDLAVDELDDDLDKGLSLARDARRRATRGESEPQDEHQPQRQADQPRIEVELPAQHLDGVVAEMVLDVFVQAARTGLFTHDRHLIVSESGPARRPASQPASRPASAAGATRTRPGRGRTPQAPPPTSTPLPPAVA